MFWVGQISTTKQLARKSTLSNRHSSVFWGASRLLVTRMLSRCKGTKCQVCQAVRDLEHMVDNALPICIMSRLLNEETKYLSPSKLQIVSVDRRSLCVIPNIATENRQATTNSTTDRTRLRHVKCITLRKGGRVLKNLRLHQTSQEGKFAFRRIRTGTGRMWSQRVALPKDLHAWAEIPCENEAILHVAMTRFPVAYPKI